MNTKSRKYRFGLALSGGGAKGFAHVGVMRALDDFGLKPDVIAGVSAGSIVAALYSAGMTPNQMLELFQSVKMSALAEFGIPTDGLFKFDKFTHFLKKKIPIERVEDLLIPTRICATSLDTYQEKVFTEGNVADCITASCSLPIIFKPKKIDGETFIDGGILHNLPAFCLREECDVLLGVNVSPLNKSPFKSSIADIAYRSYRLMTTHNSGPDLKLCDAVIQVESMKNSSTFGLNKMKDNAKEGYFAAMKVLMNSPILKQIRDEQQK